MEERGRREGPCNDASFDVGRHEMSAAGFGKAVVGHVMFPVQCVAACGEIHKFGLKVDNRLQKDKRFHKSKSDFFINVCNTLLRM